METNLHKFFSQIPDPRINRKRKHLLIDIIILCILAVICGAESWDSIEAFGKAKHKFLSKFLKLPNGIPSHDTINRVFSMIHSKKFEEVFAKWVESLKKQGINKENYKEKEIIAIDGKSICGSRDDYYDKPPIHLVSAWANSNKLVLGQRKVEGKTNEINAIPELLKLIDVEGCIVSIDAMGTQKKIVDEIIENKADYILALKSNQEYLKENVENIFKIQAPGSQATTIEKSHGRIETRECIVINDLRFLEHELRWKNMESIVKINSTRELKGKTTKQTRYFISSVIDSADNFNSFIRQHWSVENSLHWTLDVVFNEDYQRKRKGKAAENFALIQKIALNLVKSENTIKASLKNKRLKAGWDNDFLVHLIGF